MNSYLPPSKDKTRQMQAKSADTNRLVKQSKIQVRQGARQPNKLVPAPFKQKLTTVKMGRYEQNAKREENLREVT